MEDVEEFPPEPTETDEDDKIKRPNIRSAMDLQRLKLEKLMKNPAKEILIPELHKERDYLQSVPSFVRNVMGSSAGAGSGEFHVYRHLRRKEYARQKYIKSKSIREQLDDDYRDKIERNKTIAEEKTAKKRAKRQKKKLKQKQLGKQPQIENQTEEVHNENFSDDSDSDEDGKNDVTMSEPDYGKESNQIVEDNESKCDNQVELEKPDIAENMDNCKEENKIDE